MAPGHTSSARPPVHGAPLASCVPLLVARVRGGGGIGVCTVVVVVSLAFLALVVLALALVLLALVLLGSPSVRIGTSIRIAGIGIGGLVAWYIRSRSSSLTIGGIRITLTSSRSSRSSSLIVGRASTALTSGRSCSLTVGSTSVTLTSGIALSYPFISLDGVSLICKGVHTLLISACRHTQRLVPAIRRISASIELLVTAPLKGSPNVDESVSLDLELTVGITRVGNRRSSDATEGAGESLKVLALALVD